MLWHFGQRQSARAVDHNMFVIINLYAGQRRDRGACRNDNILGRDGRIAHFDTVRILEGRKAFDPCDLVFLEQKLNPAG